MKNDKTTVAKIAIGSKIKVSRLASKISQIDFARRLGLNITMLCNIENNRCKLGGALLKKFYIAGIITADDVIDNL